MICSRCGTEHEDPQKICPRCGFGRPKIRKKWPKWAIWTTGVGSAVLVIGLSIFIYMATYVDSNWLNGMWEGSDISLEFNQEEGTFFLVNGDNIFGGTYVQNQDDFTLTDEEGIVYHYRYVREGKNELQLIFNQDNETHRVTLTRVEEAEIELDPLEEELLIYE